MFGFIHTRNGKTHIKQKEVLGYLTDPLAREVFYGGAAGGAKSWTGAAWLTFLCLNYPGTIYFVGRNQLNDLRVGTKTTFSKVFSLYGIKEKQDYTYNGQDNYYRFSNGSYIYFLELKYRPSDPLFERFGSKEFTAGWIEEAGEVAKKAFEAIRSRVGRHLNGIYGIPPVIFITANPKKNWLYDRYYKAMKEGSLANDIRVVMALVDENPFIEKVYIENLEKISDQVLRARLRNGEWDYDDNPNALIDILALRNIFGNDIADRSGNKYITADIARLGSDRMVILVWKGHSVIEWLEIPKNRIDEAADIIRGLMLKHNIPAYRVIADEDGVGGGVVDILRIKGFRNGSSPIGGDNFQNLKTQCAVLTAQDINENLYSIDCYLDQETKDAVTAELEQIQYANPDHDNKIKIKPKEEIKRDIGRSPDRSDAIIMRKYFDLCKEQNDRASVMDLSSFSI